MTDIVHVHILEAHLVVVEDAGVPPLVGRTLQTVIIRHIHEIDRTHQAAMNPGQAAHTHEATHTVILVLAADPGQIPVIVPTPGTGTATDIILRIPVRTLVADLAPVIHGHGADQDHMKGGVLVHMKGDLC